MAEDSSLYINGLNNGYTSGDTNGCPNSHNIGLTNSSHLNGRQLSGTCFDGMAGLEKDKLEPIAVVGLALRFPQDATSSAAFWQMLMEGRSAMTEIPKDRFNVDAFYHTGPKKTNVLNVRGGHFITEDIAGFDASFFSLSPSEVACMDPLQRWLLETAYEALENAGISMDEINGSKTSVHIGSFLREYETMLSRDPHLQQEYKSTGNALAMLANRLSWFYNLKGPSIALDTACSSSLTALHLACQSLRCGESTMGLVGGCNLFYNPDTMIALADLNFLSPDSRCYSFDHRANGYSRGEGFGVVIIKTLSEALRNGDTIRAVIRATSATQDGRTPGITQPNSRAQEDMIRETYHTAGLDMEETRYFEAHGTGTPLGDPLEANAIHAAFNRSREEPMYIGAVKSNIGHLEGASGVAGLIKTILVLENAIIPPNIGFERVNPAIPLDKWGIKFPVEPTVWPTSGIRRASLNSFGFGGANAHAVLDDAFNYLHLRALHGKHNTREVPPSSLSPTRIASHTDEVLNDDHTILPEKHVAKPKSRLFVWSAAEESGLKRLATAYSHYLRSVPSPVDQTAIIADLAYTLSEKRSHLQWRASVAALSIDDLLQTLERGFMTTTRSSHGLKLGFVFTGQGAQWCAMGRELLDYPVFRRSLKDAELYLRSLGCTWLLVDELLKDAETSNLNDPAYSQPICTALQIALVEHLSNWGIIPTVVVGHSSGEIAAAYCSGGLSRSSAWKVAYFRGVVCSSLVKSSCEPGAMMAVALSESAIKSYLPQLESDTAGIVIACINSPKSITVSGTERLVDELKTELDRDNIFCRKLRVNVAYHSNHMNDVAMVYQQLIRDLKAGTYLREAVMISSVTGQEVSPKDLSQNEYWVRNLVSPVRFLHAITKTCMQPSKKLARNKAGGNVVRVDHFLEIGPHATFQGAIRDILSTTATVKSVGYSSILVRNRSARDTTLEAVGGLHCMGYPVILSQVNSPSPNRSHRMLVDLPAYPFNHTKKYWLESRISKNYRFRRFPYHELLGAPVTDWNPLEPRWRNIISPANSSWISDHKVFGSNVYPAAGILVMAIEAARQLADPVKKIAGYRFRDVAFYNALVVSSSTGTETQLYLRPSKEAASGFLTWSEFRLCRYENGEWSDHCQGAIAVEYESPKVDLNQDRESQEAQRRYVEVFEHATNSCTKSIGAKRLYGRFDSCGLTYGPTFQTLQSIHCNNEGEATATVDMRKWASETSAGHIRSTYAIHPAALDAVLQLIIPALTKGANGPFPIMVPTQIRNLWISDKDRVTELPQSNGSFMNDAPMRLYTKAKYTGFRNAAASILALEAKGMPRITGDFQTTFVTDSAASSLARTKRKRLCYNVDWKPDPDLLDDKQLNEYCSAEDTTQTSNEEAMVEEKMLVCHLALLSSDKWHLVESLEKHKPHLRKYAEWAARYMSSYRTNNLAYSKWTHLSDDKDFLDQLHHKVERNDAEGKLMVRVARNLTAILRGELDTLDLLFHDNAMSDYYSYVQETNYAFQKVCRYVDALAHKSPGLKVLEIGAGTGGATKDILHTLMYCGTGESCTPRFAEYTFTDISPSFFEKARDRFKPYINRMVFTTLDIQQDPLQQGFETAEYDLIIAANVLHATAKLNITLRHTRRLLKPGGTLLLYEAVTPENINPGFLFGLLPGWWLSTETDRQWSPVITERDWHERLSRADFSGVRVAIPDFEDKQRHWCSAIIATAMKTAVHLRTAPKTVVVTKEQSILQSAIADQIKSYIQKVGSPDCTIATLSGIASIDFTNASCIFLPELEEPFLYGITEDEYSGLQHIVSTAHALLWVTNNDIVSDGPTAELATGFARCIRGENPKLEFTTLALQDVRNVSLAVQKISKIFQSVFLDSSYESATEYVELDGLLCIGRVVEADFINHHIAKKTVLQAAEPQKLRQVLARRLKLTIADPGLLDTFQFVDDENSQQLASDEIEILVKASGLNFRDILIALGQDASDYLGMECAGIVLQAGQTSGFQVGDRICAMLEGSLRIYARCKAITAIKIPDDMAFQLAAAIPVVYPTALYALTNWGRIKTGESILIHSGAGGLGQACIQLAKLWNADIYVTVSSEEKKKAVQDLYNIPENHIFSSRTSAFVQGIKNMTSGRGVDIVVNSLAGEALKSSWECIAPFGRFLETGKKDIFSYSTLPMFPFSRNVMFASVDLFYQYHNSKDVINGLLQETMRLIKEKKIVLPTPLHSYNASQIEDAFRFLQSGKSIGKVVIELHDDDMVNTVPSMLPGYTFDPDATYLIAGGFGGLGRSITRWMVDRNAKHLILLARTSVRRKVAQELLDELRACAVDVASPTCDIADEQALALALESCRNMPPIKGCIQGTMALKDSLFGNMTKQDFDTAIRPKVTGSWNLHKLLPKHMDFFVLLSSCSGVVGLHGQANYACGNTYQDALARYRVARGEKAVSIDLGFLLDVGYVSENESVADKLNTEAYLDTTEQDLHAILDYYCDPALPLPSALHSQVVTGLNVPAALRTQRVEEPFWMNRPMFKPLYQFDTDYQDNSLSQDSEMMVNYESLIRAAETLADVSNIILDGVQTKLAKTLAMEKANIDTSRPMCIHGLDSLTAVEVRTWFRTIIGADVAVFEILGNGDIASLALLAAGKSIFVATSLKEKEE